MAAGREVELPEEDRTDVVTHSGGRRRHGIGGWQNYLFSGCTILALRRSHSGYRGQSHHAYRSGELIDFVVTERGNAINLCRQELLEVTRNFRLLIRPIQEIQKGGFSDLWRPPKSRRLANRSVAVVKWVDGTMLDTIYGVE